MDFFTIFDLVFLIVFSLFVIIFLYSHRKNLKREGWLFLYRTSWGINLIDYVGDKYKKTLGFLSYVSIGVGYILMGTMLYLLGKMVYVYVAYPQIVQAIKIPPIMPLIPYLPQMFELDFLPPFYFTYWLIIIVIIAITHEFAHGIFARYANVKIKSTGFGFLGPLLAFFVEQDEKDMENKSIFSQLAILSAGTFANVLTAIFFLVVMWGFFSVGFTASGVVFDTYSYSLVNVSDIISVNGISLDNPTYENILNLIDGEEFDIIQTTDGSYLATREIIEEQEGDSLILYDDAPAINTELVGAITEINGIKITSLEELEEELDKYSVGEEIEIKTITNDSVKKYEIILEENPRNGEAWLGIGFSSSESSGIFGNIISTLSSFKDEYVYYEANYEWVDFVYDLLWWIILISITIALVNMLPVGIFDGGRVFYLTILAITKSEKKAKKSFSIVTGLFFILLFVLMLFWILSFI